MVWAALVSLSEGSRKQALSLIKKERARPKDWTQAVCIKSVKEFKGQKKRGFRLALIDFGFKKNILREMLKRASQVCIFPSTHSLQDIKDWNPDGIVLSNGPGDPKDVVKGTKLVQNLLGWKALFGICMGHQVLAQAIGARTYKLKFGHRGSNHPIKDKLLNRIYISAQNHGYAINGDSLPDKVQISHINLNDNTVAGIYLKDQNCLGVQFHPENHPGPTEAVTLFDFFINNMVKQSSSSAFRRGVLSKKRKEKNAT